MWTTAGLHVLAEAAPEAAAQLPMWTDRIVAYAATAAFIVAAAALVVAVLQLKMFGRQLDQIDRSLKDSEKSSIAAEQSASAALRAAEVADKSLELSAQTARLQLRPYVELKLNSYLLKPGLTAFDVRAQMSARNAGQTPAYRLGSLARFTLAVDLPQDEFLDTSADVLEAPIFAAGAEKDLQFARIQISKREGPDPYWEEPLSLYFWGHVWYIDVFGYEWQQWFAFRVERDGSFSILSRSNRERNVGKQDPPMSIPARPS